jgi:hypothetical protein
MIARRRWLGVVSKDQWLTTKVRCLTHHRISHNEAAAEIAAFACKRTGFKRSWIAVAVADRDAAR